MFYVYILKSNKDNELYIGSTNNLKRRIEEHNNGENFSTMFRRPFTLLYYEAYKAEKDARLRESALKLRGRSRYHLMERLKNSLL
jgi:putative endonuclease